MLTILFYATNGSAAKLRSRAICAEGKGHHCRVYDVSVWDGSYDKCDAVEIMPDVQGWQRTKITDVYGEVEETIVDDPTEEELLKLQEEQRNLKKLGDLPPKQSDKKAVHRGGGRWFVTKGDDIVSGPHEKAEAQRLAALEDEATA